MDNRVVSDDETYTGEEDPQGYPRDTKVADMQPAEQAAFWKHHAYLERKARKDDNKAAEQKLAALTAKFEQKLEPKPEPKPEPKEEKKGVGQDGPQEGQKGREEGAQVGVDPAQEAERLTNYLVTSGFRAQGLKKDDVAAISPFLNFSAFLGEDGLPDDDKLSTFVKLVSVEQPTSGGTLKAAGFPSGQDHRNDVAYWMEKLNRKS